MDSFQLTLILLAPLVVGILLSQLLKMPLKGLTGVYLLLVIVNVFLWFFLLDGDVLTPILMGVAGLLAGVVATGFLYKRLNPGDFVLVMAGVGLFPWTLWGLMASLAYGVILVIFAVLIALKPKFKNPFVRRYK
jgi:hypothetical protein